jgi:hypothetical protein
MPPRYAYWTIIVDEQPTAFRAGAQEELMPTFKRLKEKHPSAVMMWFQNGKLWPSRIDAQEAMRARGEMGRRGDAKQGGFRDRKRDWAPKSHDSRPKSQAPKPTSPEKLDWKPKGEFTPAPKRAERPDWKPKTSRPQDLKTSRPEGASFRSAKPEWKPKGSFDRERKPDWKPKGAAADRRPRAFARPDFKPSGDDTRSAKPEWKPKGSFDRKPAWKPKASLDRDRKPDWKPKGSFDRERKSDWRPKPQKSDAEGGGPRRSAKREGGLEWRPRTDSGTRNEEPGTAKRKWVPKAEYKKSLGIEAKRDDKWRPGGEHRDPKQKYKDAKKAKWTKFKKTIRTRWESKTKKKS